ncbi:MAG: carbonic anhydrase [Planctomycetes bacterium]|nr:carbonic anhydrase [Planctomycetota bacterium]
MIDELLHGNQRFVESEFNNNLGYYQTIAAAQSPKILWIGCSDSRVSEDVITASKPGTIFVHRNVANIVAFNDVNVASLIQYAVVYLKIPDIIICGHTKCGGIMAIEEGVSEDYIADWLLIAQGAKERTDRIAAEQGLDREQKLEVLTRENIRLQIKHLTSIGFIKRHRKKTGLPRVHGWLYSVDTGKIEVVVDGNATSQAPSA